MNPDFNRTVVGRIPQRRGYSHAGCRPVVVWPAPGAPPSTYPHLLAAAFSLGISKEDLGRRLRVESVGFPRAAPFPFIKVGEAAAALYRDVCWRFPDPAKAENPLGEASP